MINTASAIFMVDDKIFLIRRQNYLRAFPGYSSFPGGKVDRTDGHDTIGGKFLSQFPGHLMNALVREMNEELDIDLLELEEKQEIIGMSLLGIAITPEFNPYRYKAYFYLIRLKNKPNLTVDENEAAWWGWRTANDFLKKYNQAKILAVPPTVTLIKALACGDYGNRLLDLTLPHDEEEEVPMIESLCGVRQFLPLSHTFPPANRTNCFLIGDEGEELLIDPSPQDQREYDKLLRSLKPFSIKAIFLTHHHPDHHERAPQMAKELQVPIILGEITHQLIIDRWGVNYFDGIEIQYTRDGEVLTHSLGQEVDVFAVPGHDKGQLALAPRNRHWFLAGDLIQTIGTVVIGAPEGHMGDYFKSLKMVMDLKPKFVIPSHGIIVGGIHKVEKTLKHRKMREKKILELVKEGMDDDGILQTIYSKIPSRLHSYALKTIQAHKQKLREENLIP